jgi:hypothetical protein
MEECYEYFKCNKKVCIMYGRKDDTNCWQTGETLCNHPDLNVMMEHNLDKCLYCDYFKKRMDLEK